MGSKVLLFNPRATDVKPRFPNSILAVAASIEGKYEYVIVDGNMEAEPLKKILSYLSTGDFKYFASTVMPGPQLKQAIPFTKAIREKYPSVKTIWGGYFPSNHSKTVLNSGTVDAVIRGPGDKAFPAILDAWENNQPIDNIHNIVFKKEEQIIQTPKDDLYDQDALPTLPYDKLNSFYPLKNYMGRTHLGSSTIAYHSSIGCPFTCSFCAVVPIYGARWKGKSAQGIYKDIKYLKENYGGTAIEFHDNNFFVSEKRSVEFAKLMLNENMNWWAFGRIDTMDRFKDESLDLLRKSGCKMIFFGAETGDDAGLKKINKGGTQTGQGMLNFAKRMGDFDIVPEYSFVLGLPAETPEKVMEQIDKEIEFIYKLKEANPKTEIIIYVYSPVPTVGSEMFDEVEKTGFKFPQTLDAWLNPEWEHFDLHKNPLTPWLTAEMVRKIRNFETVINGYYPTASDIKLSPFQRKVMHTYTSWRYKNKIFSFPYEIKALQKYWLRYRQPEIQGFEMV